MDAFGEHDQRCKAAFPLARHNRIQVRVTDELKKAGKFVRKASVRDLRRDRYDRSQSQADIVVENMTPATTRTCRTAPNVLLHVEGLPRTSLSAGRRRATLT